MSEKKTKNDPHAKAAGEKHGDAAAPAKSGGLGGKIAIAAFVSFVIIAETVIFFFMVPSGEEIAVLAEQKLIASAQEIDSAKDEHHKEDDKIVEFDLGLHPIPFVPPGADHTYRVEFKLFATIHSRDAEHLQALFEEREGRFRHRLMLEIRNTSLNELSENQLGLLQRRILATSTEVLGEPILLSIGFREYQLLED